MREVLVMPPTQREHERHQTDKLSEQTKLASEIRYYILPPLRLHFALNFLRSLPCKFLALA
jgi:hypothetical protein